MIGVDVRFTTINCFNAKNGNGNLRVITAGDYAISCIEVSDTNIANLNNWIIEPNVSLALTAALQAIVLILLR